MPTTAGCREYAYTPEHNAFVVQLLIDAGALPIGKTNLDQFATGLNGTRSPWGACHNAFDPEYVSGGSSSGSAVAVALGYVSFTLGTDTAGSGRVPAVIVLEPKELAPEAVLGLAAMALALTTGYYLVKRAGREGGGHHSKHDAATAVPEDAARPG